MTKDEEILKLTRRIVSDKKVSELRESELLARIKYLEDAIKAKGGSEHYPTQDAYDLACKAIEKHRDRVETLEAKLETYHEEYENRKEGYEKTIDSLEEKLASAEKERDHWKEYSSGQGELIESGVFVTNEEYVKLIALEAKLAAAEKTIDALYEQEAGSSL